MPAAGEIQGLGLSPALAGLGHLRGLVREEEAPRCHPPGCHVQVPWGPVPSEDAGSRGELAPGPAGAPARVEVGPSSPVKHVVLRGVARVLPTSCSGTGGHRPAQAPPAAPAQDRAPARDREAGLLAGGQAGTGRGGPALCAPPLPTRLGLRGPEAGAVGPQEVKLWWGQEGRLCAGSLGKVRPQLLVVVGAQESGRPSPALGPSWDVPTQGGERLASTMLPLFSAPMPPTNLAYLTFCLKKSAACQGYAGSAWLNPPPDQRAVGPGKRAQPGPGMCPWAWGSGPLGLQDGWSCPRLVPPSQKMEADQISSSREPGAAG